MSVASAMAVSFVGGRFFYILSGTTKDDITQREVGTEQLRPLKDPYTVFGDLEYAEAKRHYRNHNYERAHGIFAKLAGTEGMPEPDKICYQAYEHLTCGYAAWDVFDWQTAQTALQTLLASPLPTELEPERSRLAKQHTMLKRLAEDNKRITKIPRKNILRCLCSRTRRVC